MKEITLFYFDLQLRYISVFTVWTRFYESRSLLYVEWGDRFYLDLFFIHVLK